MVIVMVDEIQVLLEMGSHFRCWNIRLLYNSDGRLEAGGDTGDKMLLSICSALK